MHRFLLPVLNIMIFMVFMNFAGADESAADADALETQKRFTAWLAGARQEALDQGISQATVDGVFLDINFIPKVIDFDRKQPEFSLTFAQYLEKVISKGRIKRGQKRISKHNGDLTKITGQYQVPARFIVALWGIETDYGNLTGGFPVVGALATLAFEGRRAAFFRTELFHALRILDAGHIDAEFMTGSWAGAMGQCQFMPSSFQRFAVDEDNDGHKDIWRSTEDVMASIANYLHESGWNNKYTWGREVRLPKKFDATLIGLDTRKYLQDWHNLGVRNTDRSRLPQTHLQAALLQPDGPGTPAYLVYDNFDVILKWNRSHSFALAVGHLADSLREN